ncbi:PREDICTED: ninja-family protein AFP3 [Tarenaya hassleriana]|uniref:ninja-family protein AFP3 n=1 Tax=Tarenaya hassleriana TaxID=28532 RepID=UPI00053CA990|nr:PREDICTED: ninja-family protein AFP3 [Tarenaya hassleriana]XP_010528409.1 PREDICTED: ninja-family protein AFP3 [Tarenaya hassleriana]XP_010528410.1 PREDICTED: ninja-family protein AFP3 [Tarenaya hassleriana]
MSEAENRGNGETRRRISGQQVSSLPRDLLQRFMSSKDHCYPPYQNRSHTTNGVEDDDDDEEDVELSLGLSLNGRFGVDPLAKSKLTRSSSIPEFIITSSVKSKTSDSDRESSSPAHVGASATIMRTCSLPTETEEEWRKRKELQSLRRLEAKRKRSEKQRTQRGLREKRKSVAEEKDLEDRREEGSIGSSGSGASCLSELDSHHTPVQATNKLPDTMAAAATPPLPEKPDNSGENRAKETVLEDMPFVSTKGDGPNGKRIEGFLYRYRKGEEVRIVCVCHGSFLSPAEFVKHAGGGDVAHPLKHIVVNPSPLM